MRILVWPAWLALLSGADPLVMQADAYAAMPVEKRTFPNGLRVLVLPRGEVPWCAVTTVLVGGSHQDPPGKSGLAHLAEHLLFEGDAPGSLDARAEKLGMRSNAFTLPDYVVLVDEFSPAVVDEALAIHAGRVKTRVIPGPRLQREKNVVLDERRLRVLDPPLGQADEELLRVLWGTHPFARPILGRVEEMMSIDVAVLDSFSRMRLTPETTVVAIVGHLDAGRTWNAVERAFGTWKRPLPPPVPLHAPTLPETIPAGKGRLELQGTVEAVMYASVASSRGSQSEPADRLLAQLLEGDAARHLSQNRGEWPLDLTTEYRAQMQAGELVMTLYPTPPMSLADAEGALDWLFGAYARLGPTADALANARAQIAARHQQALQIHVNLAERLAADEALSGRWDEEQAQLRRMAHVHVDEVRARAAALRSGRRAVMVQSLRTRP
jgi:zinc protease